MKFSRKILISILATTVLAVGGFYFWQNQGFFGQASIVEDYDPGLETKTQPIPEKDEEETKNSSSPAPNGTGNEGQSTAPLDATITLSSWNQQDDGSVYITAIVSGTTTGECAVRLKRGGNTIERKAELTKNPTGHYYCGPFTIARSAFSAAGSWEVRAFLTVSGQTVESQEEEVNIQ